MPRFTACFCLLILCVAADAAERLPFYFLELPATIASVFVADTESATMYRFSNGPDGMRLVAESFFSVGERGIGKRRAWDRKTPLGIYFVVDRLETNRLHEKYGILAFPLDYPNVRDRQAGRTGDGIWVHGVQQGLGRRPRRDTDGCLALPNEELADFAPFFEVGTTPVVVTRAMRWQEESALAEQRAELGRYLELWRVTLAEALAAAHLSLYSENFSYRGLPFDDWREMREATLAGTDSAVVSLKSVVMLADPQEAGLYLTRFDLVAESGSGRRQTTKRLYWRRNDAGGLSIVAEDNG